LTPDPLAVHPLPAHQRVVFAVGLVAVIRKILFVLSSEEPVSTAELALLIAMIAVLSPR
jgi:uncharacterized membrane protein (DUF373 family)